MDEIAYVLIQQEEEDDEDAHEQELKQSAALAAVALMVIGGEESCRLCTEHRQPSQLYLCWPQLLPNPCKDIPCVRSHYTNILLFYIYFPPTVF